MVVRSSYSLNRRLHRPQDVGIHAALLMVILCTSGGPLAFGQEVNADVQKSSAVSVDFERQIRPILEKHCWSCHGAERQESGLRLDRQAAVLEGGDQGRIVIAGRSGESRLIQYVTSTDPEKVMPPEGDRLTESDVSLLRAWIDAGVTWSTGDDAVDPRLSHWAWQPISQPVLPVVAQPGWVRNPVDQFVLARLEQHGLRPSPEADRVTLIRRLSLDLTGLLPSPEEVDAFVRDDRADAYEQLVDRFLASPHFGERWGRHWLDMARYADSDGYEKDNARPDAWRYRDWVIDAINRDLPFDQFTIQQIAGDLLPDATPMQLLATAFHRQTLTNTEGGTDQEEFRVAACFDRTETTGSVWLGLTIGCARCHTHKYDPISQREYYQLYSFFNNGDEQTTVVPVSEKAVAEYQTACVSHEKRIRNLQEKLEPLLVETALDYQKWLSETEQQVSSTTVSQPNALPFSDVQYSGSLEEPFEKLPDGSVLSRKSSSIGDTYVVTGQLAETQLEFTSLRLDVLPHETLPSQGPGLGDGGAFVLSEVTVEIADSANFSDARPLELSRAIADFEQSDGPWKAENAIDQKSTTGWAIGPQYGKPHWIKVGLRTPLKVTRTIYLRVKLSHDYGIGQRLGRFLLTPQSGTELGSTLSDELLAALKIPEKDRSSEQRRSLREHYSRMDVRTRTIQLRLDKLRENIPVKPDITVRVIGQRRENPRKTFVLRRGEFLQPVTEQETQPGGLSILPPLEIRGGSPGDRLDLARWLVRDDHPLTSRVAANHVWRILFGQGLVRTPGDFGVRGEKPTHPELLDWLAKDFIGTDSGSKWSRKALIRRIVTSATYRQSSHHRPELMEADPQNFLLGRQNRIRVEGEIVRDISLQAAGLLSRQIGGPSVYPPLPSGIAELSYAGNFVWSDSKGEDRYRRGMYTFFKRTSPHPNLMTFDCPDANITSIARQISNTPLQALTTLNNETFAEAARAFAEDMLQEKMDDEQRLIRAFRRCVARAPKAGELMELSQLLNDARQWCSNHPDLAAKLGSMERKYEKESLVMERAAWIAVTRILLNLDEFLTRE